MLLKKQKVSPGQIKNYTQFEEILQTRQESELQQKIKENEAYIEYIKLHDKEAYENYLSYATYLELCV
jgi:hypothetical protein